MVSVQALANTILKKSFDDKRAITPMKLQKLLYFVYKDFLQTTGKQLFSERFEVWQYGPVVDSVYHDFKAFGAQPITRFAKDAQGTVFVVKSSLTDVINSINKIWEKYKYYTGCELSRLTHQQNSAWSKAIEKRNHYLDDGDIKDEEY